MQVQITFIGKYSKFVKQTCVLNKKRKSQWRYLLEFVKWCITKIASHWNVIWYNMKKEITIRRHCFLVKKFVGKVNIDEAPRFNYSLTIKKNLQI